MNSEVKQRMKCGMCGYIGVNTDDIGQCPNCRWDELQPTDEPMRHVLKIVPDMFAVVVAGAKTAEYRINDRDYRVGDALELREFVADGAYFTGAATERRISHILGQPWTPEGYVVLSLDFPLNSGKTYGTPPAVETKPQSNEFCRCARCRERSFKKDTTEFATWLAETLTDLYGADFATVVVDPDTMKWIETAWQEAMKRGRLKGLHEAKASCDGYHGTWYAHNQGAKSARG